MKINMAKYLSYKKKMEKIVDTLSSDFKDIAKWDLMGVKFEKNLINRTIELIYNEFNIKLEYNDIQIQQDPEDNIIRYKLSFFAYKQLKGYYLNTNYIRSLTDEQDNNRTFD